MSAPIETKKYRVDPSRLASGSWCHSRNRLIGEGDIAASYSADKIAQGKVRKPFSWSNGLWVCTGTHYQSKGKSAEDYRLMFYAQPYDLSATSFYFAVAETHSNKITAI